MASNSDIIVLAVGLVLAAVYLFRDQLFAQNKPKAVPVSASKASNGSGNPRDFVAKMKEGVSVAASLASSLESRKTNATWRTEKTHRHLLRLANRYR